MNKMALLKPHLNLNWHALSLASSIHLIWLSLKISKLFHLLYFAEKFAVTVNAQEKHTISFSMT
jgi:hypothetical protein